MAIICRSMKAIHIFDRRYVHLLIWISVCSCKLQYLSHSMFSLNHISASQISDRREGNRTKEYWHQVGRCDLQYMGTRERLAQRVWFQIFTLEGLTTLANLLKGQVDAEHCAHGHRSDDVAFYVSPQADQEPVLAGNTYAATNDG